MSLILLSNEEATSSWLCYICSLLRCASYSKFYSREVPPVEQKLPQLLQSLYEQQNIILGFLYSVTGSGIQHDGSSISPAATSVNETINGTTHTWQGLNLDQRPKPGLKQLREMPFNLQKFIKHLVRIRNRHNSNHRKHKRHRYHNYLLAISLISNPVFANTSNTSCSCSTVLIFSI